MKAKRINVGQTKIGELLSEMDPEAQPNRQNIVGSSLYPKICNAKVFAGKVHYDQNEKLGIFRVVHVCLRNGFSCKIVGHAKIARKNKLVIYEEEYRLVITFSLTKIGHFGFLKYLKFLIVFSETALWFNIKTSLLMLYNDTSFY